MHVCVCVTHSHHPAQTETDIKLSKQDVHTPASLPLFNKSEQLRCNAADAPAVTKRSSLLTVFVLLAGVGVAVVVEVGG